MNIQFSHQQGKLIFLVTHVNSVAGGASSQRLGSPSNLFLVERSLFCSEGTEGASLASRRASRRNDTANPVPTISCSAFWLLGETRSGDSSSSCNPACGSRANRESSEVSCRFSSYSCSGNCSMRLKSVCNKGDAPSSSGSPSHSTSSGQLSAAHRPHIA